ncbi:PAS domain S-box protein [Stutzerimonas stutzeri]|uniref:Diguanylate cyclase n=1 Tax=Stutzerimonas stutzeri TaxID=316 RepID=A0A172WKP9_STUST|nr:PAS domain S-box protein [Stutzerimonas stutzeri]ANF24043.1 diguanylate cyclase [Stutzerimonas stutzeri]
MVAPHPANEVERLQLLHALQILDTDPEPVFDRLTRLLAHTLGTPIALVSLIDEHRQWFKSRVGLNVSETPRDQAFCAHAILDGEPLLVVPDAYLDERFADNPLVLGSPHIRAYAGAPIRTQGGLALGTLCAIDTRPRAFTGVELQILQDMADMVAREMHLRETLLLARSQLSQADELLVESEERYRSVFELASVGIAIVAPDGTWQSVNEPLCRIVGYSAAELLKMTFQDITHPEDLDDDLDLVRKLASGELDAYHLEKRYVHREGHAVWIKLSVSKKLSAQGELEYFIAVIRDIQARKEAEEGLAVLRRELEARVQERTEQLLQSNRELRTVIDSRQRAEQEARDREAELAAVIEHATDAYISLDQNGVVRAWNRVAEETFGWSISEAIGHTLDQLIVPSEMRAAHHAGIARYLAIGESTLLGRRLELPALRKDGSHLTVEMCVRALHLGGKTLFSAFLHDISERKLHEAQRESEARHDALTGLLNRRGLTELLPIALSRADRSVSDLGLLFIDLDGFKAVNDTFGHEAGDELLRAVAVLLQQCVRETDSVVRLAGDEFTVLLEGLASCESDARLVAEKVLAAIAQPISTSHGLATVSASIGISCYTAGSDKDAAQLMREADERMYQAKRAGKGRAFSSGDASRTAVL